MATSIKISQLPAKGANLEATDLLEVSEFNGTGYVTKSITGQEIIDASAGGGVTNITVNAPLSTTGGTTPDLAISEADASTDGFITAVDWNTFNDKQELLVSGTNIKTINGSSVLGSGDLTISGGGGLQGIHALLPLSSGQSTYPSTASQGIASTSIIFNRVNAVPFIPNQNITTSSLYINVAGATPTANARILIYSSLNESPDQKLYESTNLDCSTTGIKTATTTFNFVAGTTYWLCVHTSANFNLSFINSSGLFPLNISGVGNPLTYVYVTATFGSAPTTFGTPIYVSGNAPFIGITKA